ncbi:hypothetical protein QBZ16_000517 [Prototheca wickerhamii]|uniref:Uncharacterized protein n=1 Tax=Prototheca wickerhamii TaxID=3111 RepID=A0AAD9ILQ1_PROWI|nr:hypothetical protein QBZ16_000517 [Prototheca wickerhamii]
MSTESWDRVAGSEPGARANFDFFLTIAMGFDNKLDAPNTIDFVVVQSGEACTPCQRMASLLHPTDPVLDSVRSAATATIGSGSVTHLVRKANEGMDFAAHNTTITYLTALRRLHRYSYFFLLNSSIRGPFVPSYMPPGWQWTQAFIDRLVSNVGVVSSSLVCLPEEDAGGPGPKLESWAAATHRRGLDILVEEGVFELRTCKTDGVVVKGEYGLTAAMEKHGYTIDTLMSKYRRVDWGDKSNWNCNNNVHPSRHGTYDGISMHPYETVFVKASWHVGHPFIDKYAEWAIAQATGQSTTAGQLDEEMYRYAISMEAQEDHHVDQCYKVLPRDKKP